MRALAAALCLVALSRSAHAFSETGGPGSPFNFEAARQKAREEAPVAAAPVEADPCAGFGADAVEPDSERVLFEADCVSKPAAIKHDTPFVTFDALADANAADADREAGLYPTQQEAVGRTRGDLKKHAEIAWQGKDYGPDQAQFRAKIKIKFKLVQKMGLSSNYKDGTSEYRVAYEHEMLHWRDNIEAHRAALAAFKAELVKLGWDKPFLFGKSTWSSDTDKIMDRLKYELMPRFAKMYTDAASKRENERHPLGYENQAGEKMVEGR